MTDKNPFYSKLYKNFYYLSTSYNKRLKNSFV
jgi:hypothetical protein